MAKHTLQHYANLYGVSKRTIGRYKTEGYPLDDERTTRALIAGQHVSKEYYNPAGIEPSLCAPGALGLRASIQRLQEAEERAHARYMAAEGAEARGIGKEWLELTE